MGLVPVTTQVEEKTYAFAKGLAKFGADLVKAVKAGGGTLQEVEAVVAAAVADLAPVAGNMSSLVAEEKDNVIGFVKAWELAGDDFVQSVIAP